MYRKVTLPRKTTLKVCKVEKGERIEEKVYRITTNKEVIKDGAPIVYTERKDGVRPEYNIRTDKSEIAVEKMDFIARTNEKKRQDAIGKRAAEGMAKEKGTEKEVGGTETKGGTNGQDGAVK